MSLFERRTLLAGLLLLAGCGFTPVYGPGGNAEGLRGTVEVDEPDDPAGFALVRRLEDLLGIPADPSYRLTAQIRLTELDLGVTPDQEITRYHIIGRSSYTLFEISSGKAVSTGSVDNFTSYSATGTPFATTTAQRDARDRLMSSLADQIVSRLLATSGEWR